MAQMALRCTRCEERHIADMVTVACRNCGAPLDVDYERGYRAAEWAGLKILLPKAASRADVSLGEGNTPCVRLPAVGDLLGLRRLYGKLEYLNPTGSFKDRGTAVMIAVAREHGVTEVVEDSSGNAGASVSAYAARAGIKAHIFAPASAPPAKLRQIRAYGAEVHSIEGPREATTAAAVAYYTERQLVYASHVMSPYFMEGTKTFAYEVVHRFRTALPDHLVFPVGNGSLFIGAWKGFRELRDAGYIARAPRLHCVQSRAVMPLVAAYNDEKPPTQATAGTVAGGIAVAAPARKEQILNVLRSTDGAAVTVEESDILRWQAMLSRKEGVYGEPTSAAAFAGLERLVGQGTIGPDDTVLAPITGFGLKDIPPE